MPASKTVRGKVTTLRRLVNSRNGNPRYAVIISDREGFEHNAQTKNDSTLALRITSGDYWEITRDWAIDHKGNLTEVTAAMGLLK